MCIDVEEEAVHAKGEVAVKQGFDGCRCLVPYSAHLSEALGLYDVLSVDVSSAYRIEHIVRLVVCRRVEPILSHGIVGIAVMVHTVSNHRGRDAL